MSTPSGTAIGGPIRSFLHWTEYAWIGSNYGALCGGESAADGVTHAASHELFETLTDPLIHEPNGVAWYDGGPNDQGEIADICDDGVGYKTSLNGFESYVNPIFVSDPSYVSASGVQTGGYCASGNPLASASSVPEAGTWLLMLAGLAVMGLERTRRKTTFNSTPHVADGSEVCRDIGRYNAFQTSSEPA